MRPFSILGARHYCQSFQSETGHSERSPEEFRQLRLNGRVSLQEGNSLFDEYRACSLRDAERCLFLSASHYRRGLDLMIPSASHWAHVTLYYGAWFAAHALLGMFGCRVYGKHVVQVVRSSPGTQTLELLGIGSRLGQYYVSQSGSHRRFWEIFYQAASSIRPFVDPAYARALTPVLNNNSWLIDQRNKVNYDTLESLSLGNAFVKTFSDHSFPGCLPGELNTQYSICEGILEATCGFATQFGFATDALDAIGSHPSFDIRVKELVYAPPIPNLVGQTRKQQLFGKLT